MKLNRLVSSRVFGELLRSEEPGFKKIIDYLNWYEKLRNNYDDFLKQPLTLGMFVPCDLDGNVLEEPDFMSGDYNDNGYGDVDKYQYKKDLKEYQEAKDRVLFEGFEYKKTNWDLADLIHLGKKENKETIENNNHHCYLDLKELKSKTIEYLAKYNLELTSSALKQIGL